MSAPRRRGAPFDCREHSWCCDQDSPEYLDDDETLRLPLRLNQMSERKNGVFVSVGVHEGNRPYMEDRHRVMYARDGHRGYFAVHDGHGGSEAAQYLAENLYEDMITALDEKLRSNKRFKSKPDEPSKRLRTPTKNTSESTSDNSTSSEKSKSSSTNPANGVVPKKARPSLPAASLSNPLNDQKTSASEISPLDVELTTSNSLKSDNSSKLQNSVPSSPLASNENLNKSSDADPRTTSNAPAALEHDVHLEDHETEETVELVTEALREGCFSCESHLLDSARVQNFTSGSTSVSVFIRGNHLYAVNVGDSRAVLCRGGQAVDLSNDHKPGVPSERQRIEENEGEVGQMVKSLPLCCAFFGEKERSVGAYRVWPGGLSVSRTFGDVNYKDPSLGKTHSPHILIADPEIKVMEISPDDEFMILATDGFWDVMSSQDAVKFLRKKKRKKKFVPARAGSMLCDRAYNFGSGDNITCIVVYFTHHSDSWARTPHRAPDQLTRIPYRVDASCQTVQSLDVSAQPMSNGSDDDDSDAHESPRSGETEVKNLHHDDAASTHSNSSASPDRRLSNSRSKSNRKSVSKSHSKSRPRGATPRKSSRSGSYNRSASKNDSRNGYRRQSLEQKVQADDGLAKSESRASSSSTPQESPSTSSPVVAASDSQTATSDPEDVASDPEEVVASAPEVSEEPEKSSEWSNGTSPTPSQSSSQRGKSHRRERTEPTPAIDSPFADVKDALKSRNSLPSPLTKALTDAPAAGPESLSAPSKASPQDEKSSNGEASTS